VRIFTATPLDVRRTVTALLLAAAQRCGGVARACCMLATHQTRRARRRVAPCSHHVALSLRISNRHARCVFYNNIAPCHKRFSRTFAFMFRAFAALRSAPRARGGTATRFRQALISAPPARTKGKRRAAPAAVE